ncbi:MAG: 2-isopropylmalate synthase [Gammaproteobacteria bacterium]|nr:2-isopropylmalate synthase [Gammaproteobacteria bacterium]
MTDYNYRKYPTEPAIEMKKRRWPDNTIQKAPVWCSVDLRDGNQALIEPMTTAQKEQMFNMLVDVGFKEIEVGFPSASQPDYDFVRQLIDEDRVPDDVAIQVLTQARPELIERTFESLKGAKKAILHFYNSTSIVQREKVFELDKAGITDIAVQAARLVKQKIAEHPETDWMVEYSPESFTGTEMDYAVEICNAVIDVFEPTPSHPMIINLPATVEMTTPNIYADRIEWFLDHINRREGILLSIHTHNDRGCAVAAAELAVLAGADRIEGTVLGNGERTGNMDVVTMAMNLYSQGIDPTLDFSDMDRIVKCVKECTNLPVHPRHPYAGELVYTAFSGSHQDAIKKCLDKYTEGNTWEIAYLPIDPRDLGRTYQEVIRINSQSGKGGVAYVVENEYGMELPRWLQIDFSRVVQRWTETHATEISSRQIWALFNEQYIDRQDPYHLKSYQLERTTEDTLSAVLGHHKDDVRISGQGNGAINAFINALGSHLGVEIDILEYSEHALSGGAEATAVAYVQAKCQDQRYCGVAMSEDILSASLNAVLSAVNQNLTQMEKAA